MTAHLRLKAPFIMKSIFVILLVLMTVARIFIVNSHAAHPLITDDTGTQGKEKILFELNGQASYDRTDSIDNTGIKTKTRREEQELKIALTYGAAENVDVILGMPYQRKKTEDGDSTVSDGRGIADILLEVKWRFYETDGLSFALKPGLTLPTGDKDKDLGTGRATGSLFFVVTKEVNPLAFHWNVGYKRNENQLQQREDIWYASMAGEYKVIRNLKLAADIGVERNTDPSSSTPPASLLGGIIYSLRGNLDIDVGVKIGLNNTAQDIAFMGGIALRF